MNDTPYGIIVTIVVGAFVVVAINDWQKRRLAKRAWDKGEKPQRWLLDNRTSWGFMVVATIAILVAAAIKIQWNDFSPELRGTLMHTGTWLKFGARVAMWVLGVVVAAVVLLVIFANVGIRLTRWRNRDFVQVQTLILQGSTEAAIDLVQRILDGPGQQVGTAKHQAALYYLAVAEGMRGNWQETLLLIERLEPYSRSPHVFVATKSLAFWQLGRLEDAERGFRERVRVNPDNAIGQAALGLFLVNTDRTAEASTVLQSVDCMVATKSASPAEIDLTEHLRHATNSRRHLGPDVTPAESDLAMRQLLTTSMEGIVFRDWKGPPPTSQPAST